MITTNLPWVTSPFFDEILATKNLTAEQTKIVSDYHYDGFVVISGLLPESLIDRVQKDTQEKAFDPDFPIKTQRDEKRIQDFWKVSEACRELAAYKDILDILQLLYDRRPIPFQTLNFRVGTQQRAHSDTIHFSSLPAQFMCGVWVALEDITEENGPVFYFPGSHKLPEYDFSIIKNTSEPGSYDQYANYEDFIEHIVRVNGFEKKKFLAKKGDLLIWSSNIIHGGSPVTKEGVTRWSQVTHYFFEDCYYYTPMLSNMVTRELYLRDALVDITTGQKMPQSYNGKKLKKIVTDKKLFMLSNNFGFIKGIFRSMKSKLK
jgi:hypothetical protein